MPLSNSEFRTSNLELSCPVPHPTVTVNAQVALPPLLSIARHTTVVTLAGNSEPLLRPLSRYTDCTVQLSENVGVA